MTMKSKIWVYHELDFPELLAIHKKNKRKPGADPARRKFQDGLRQVFQDDLRREYEDSMATPQLLLARIEETDRLIDEIVYKLYGLTDEDVGIVEQAVG